MFGPGFQPCGDKPSTPDVVECVQAKTKVADQRLNAAYKAYAFGCLHLPDRPVLHSVKAIGVAVLDPQALRRQQRLTLSGIDPGLQRSMTEGRARELEKAMTFD
jgi:hypothetical protein